MRAEAIPVRQFLDGVAKQAVFAIRAIAQLCRIFDRKGKVLFGTNWPMIAPAKCMAELAALGLDEETQRAFLHDNAAKVFCLGAG